MFNLHVLQSKCSPNPLSHLEGVSMVNQLFREVVKGGTCLFFEVIFHSWLAVKDVNYLRL